MKTVLVVGAGNSGKTHFIQQLGPLPNVQFAESITFEHKDRNHYDVVIVVYDTNNFNADMLQSYCNNACDVCNIVMVYGSKGDAPLLNMELHRARANNVQVLHLDVNQIRTILNRMPSPRRSE